MVTIIADEEKNNVGMDLYQGFLAKGIPAEYIPLNNVQVKPCYNCNGCMYKTYGKCVIRDDGDLLFPKLIRADPLIIVTPITFGSYSFKVKRVLDKLGLIMDKHYFVENKELVKGGMLGRRYKIFAVGVTEDCLIDEAEAFKKLVHEIHIIIRGTGKAFISGLPSLASATKCEIIKEVMGA